MNIDQLYITEKEAAYRYGYSVQWFQRSRWQGGDYGPKYLKIRGKVLYPLKETDKWFAKHSLRSSTSEKGGASHE